MPARLVSSIVAGVVLCGCDPSTDVPILTEPVVGSVFDRCLARVHASPPGDVTQIHNAMVGSGASQGSHLDWRTNGSERIEVDNATLDRGTVVNYVFSLALVPGANHVEIAKCDSVDTCAASATVDATVTLGPGSPDPAFSRAGQAIYGDYLSAGFNGAHALRLTDGRMVVPMNSTKLGYGIVALKKDGSIDTSFGDKGIETSVAGGLLAAASDGGIFALAAAGDLHRLGAHGAVDMSFGTKGVVQLTTPVAATFSAFGIAADDSGGCYIAAEAPRSALAPMSLVPLVMHVDAAGKVQKAVLADDAGLPGVLDGAIRKDGMAVFLLGDRFIRASVDGLDVAFGSGGSAALGETVARGRVALTNAGAAALYATGGGVLRLLRASPGAPATHVDLPIHAADSYGAAPGYDLAADADGTLYAVGVVPHPADLASSWLQNPMPGTDVAVVRVRGASPDLALDGTWAAAATSSSARAAHIATVSFMNSFRPISTETVIETPHAVLVDGSGAPILIGSSTGTGTDLFTRRGPSLSVAQLLH